MRFYTPQTEDGRATSVANDAPGRLTLDVEFPVSAEFASRAAGDHQNVRFVPRSRIARLGISIAAASPITFSEGRAFIRATADAVVTEYEIEPILIQLLLPGVEVGRLVYCDPAKRLSAEQVYAASLNHEFQLPAHFTIDNNGDVTFATHRCIYDLQRHVSHQDLLGVIARHDGKRILNRIQIRRAVEHVLLAPHSGVITSCTMFLHRHFALLDASPTTQGQHLESTVLDPITTRGTRVFLEFANRSDRAVVNPSATAALYLADQSSTCRRDFVFIHAATSSELVDQPEYHYAATVYREQEQHFPSPAYVNRPMTVLQEPLRSPQNLAHWADNRAPKTTIASSTARGPGRGSYGVGHFDIPVIAHIPDGANATVFVKYFPNVLEHTLLCHAAARQRIQQLVFRQASFEHGAFLSARDHARLADYDALGVKVFWCNDDFRELAVHVYRGLRGYFIPLSKVDSFLSRLIFAVYGSTLPLTLPEASAQVALLERLRAFLGGNVAFLTGGGPGAMQQTAEAARSLGVGIGCNFLEIQDQPSMLSVDFYQTFQERARHFRQRWFDIASFHIFCIGGVGTLEEVGLTLTDMKLGVAEKGPLVFFGQHGDAPYWAKLKEQFDIMLLENRGPQWLKTHILLTNDPDEVVHFYRRTLEVG